MKILVITRNAWDDTNAIGNTLSNFFQGVDNLEFAALYFRTATPDNALCRTYYRTSEMEILRKWFRPDRIGKSFCLTDDAKADASEATAAKSAREKKLIHMIQRYGVKLAYKLSDALWYSKKWINANLDDFITSYAPDVMVTFVKAAPQYYLTIRHLREHFHIPLFTWIADDEYTGLQARGAQKEIEQLRYILSESAVVRGCSEEMCAYYNSVFGCHAEPLYKSCDLSVPVKEKTNTPVTMVYAGNLLYGRLDILRRVSDVLEDLSQNGTKVVLEIYSNTALLPDEEQTCFGGKQSVHYMGKRDYAYIMQRLASADLVLHVESFEPEQILKTKYSFSTKIMDGLQSGSVMLAVGPQEQASMRYIAGIPGACVINRLEDLPQKLAALLENSADFQARAAAIRRYAEEYHSLPVAAAQMTQLLAQAAMRK